jgi:hypothetical protein
VADEPSVTAADIDDDTPRHVEEVVEDRERVLGSVHGADRTGARGPLEHRP